MKNAFLIGLAIAAAYSAFDTMALTTKTLNAIDAQSFERENCIQYVDGSEYGGVYETCKQKQ